MSSTSITLKTWILIRDIYFVDVLYSAKCSICSVPLRVEFCRFVGTRWELRVSLVSLSLSLSLSKEYLHIFLINSALSKSVNKMVGCGRVCHFWFPVDAIESVSSPFFPEGLWVPPSLLGKEYRGFLYRVVKTVWACSWLFSCNVMPNWMQETFFTHPVHFYSLNVGTPFHSRCFGF